MVHVNAVWCHCPGTCVPCVLQVDKGEERRGERNFGAMPAHCLSPRVQWVLFSYSLLPDLFPFPPSSGFFPPDSQFWSLCKWHKHAENTLKPSVKLLGSWVNANMVLRCLSRGMEYKSAQLILASCKASGRPHLEYGVQLWSLYYGKDIWWIVKRQGGATKKMTQHFRTGVREREGWMASLWGCLVLQIYFIAGCQSMDHIDLWVGMYAERGVWWHCLCSTTQQEHVSVLGKDALHASEDFCMAG